MLWTDELPELLHHGDNEEKHKAEWQGHETMEGGLLWQHRLVQPLQNSQPLTLSKALTCNQQEFLVPVKLQQLSSYPVTKTLFPL